MEDVERRLRVACVWNGTFQAEELYRDQPVELGQGRSVLFGLPADVVPAETVTIVEPLAGGGWALRLEPSMGGDVWVAGERRFVADLVTAGTTTLPIGEEDYGVITVGSVALFFQQVSAPPEPPRQRPYIEGGTAAALGLSVFAHTAALLLAAMTLYHMPEREPLELPTDLVARIFVTPPPESVLDRTRGEPASEVDPSELTARDEPAQARAPRAPGDPGASRRSRSPRPSARASSAPTDLGGDNPIAAATGIDIGRTIDGIDRVRVVAPGLGRTGLRTGGDGDGSVSGPLGVEDVDTRVDRADDRHDGDGDGPPGPRARREREIRVDLGQGTSNDPRYLSEHQIARVVRRRSRAIRFCYELGLNRDHDLSGVVTVEWRIGLSGSVTTGRIVRSSLGNPRVEGCILNEVRRWRFPRPDGGEVVVSYPLLLGRGD